MDKKANKKYIIMGIALTTCKTCDTFQSYDTSNELCDISDYYTGRLAEFKQVLPQIPQYLDVTHSRLVNDLRSRDDKFQDFLFPSENLVNNTKIEWKRISQVYPRQHFAKENINFEFELKKNYGHKSQIINIEDMLTKLSKYPDLLKKIFVNLEKLKEGFYVLYFCLSGNIIKRIEIVIDDFIPINHQGRYLFNQPKEGNGIWMLLVEKAWAKILKSYHNINKKSSNQLFSQTTGVPIPDLYKAGDFLISGKYDFQPYQSKYLKICRDTPVQMLLSIWQSSQQANHSTESLCPSFVIELMAQYRTPNGVYYNLEEMSTISSNKKLTLVNAIGHGMFYLLSGKHIVHIFNRSLIQKQCNVVIHARMPVNAHTRYEKQFKDIKMSMIKNEYNKIHQKIDIQYEYPGIELKFCWIKHRGIFELINTFDEKKTMQIFIKKQFVNNIIFEDSKENNKVIVLEIKQKCLVVVIRRQDQEYGNFYKINMKT